MKSYTLPLPTYSSEAAPQPSTPLDRWMLARLHDLIAAAPVGLELWDGYERSLPGRAPLGTIVIKNRPALIGLLWNVDVNFGEAFMSGAVEVRGDLVAVLEAAFREMAKGRRRPWWLPHRPNDVSSAQANAHYHYDLGNDFYRLWLDREMVYTCAFFPEPDCTLEEAQAAKMDRVCRKLRLRPGERVAEAGCGWGSLALFMARQYGVSVRAFNISTEQIAYARERAREEGLSDKVEFVHDDYRSIRGTYDAFVSVGMLEHVGLHDFQTFGRVIDRTLGESGRGLLHFIGRNTSAPLNRWIQRRIFPGGYPPTLREVFERVLEPRNLSVLDIENLRLHYSKTLEHWRRRFDDAADVVAQKFDASFVRAWRLYLAGSEAAFSAGSTQLFQIVFARGSTNAIPWIRDKD